MNFKYLERDQKHKDEGLQTFTCFTNVCHSVMEDPVKHQDPFRHTALEQNTLGCADEDSKVIFFYLIR